MKNRYPLRLLLSLGVLLFPLCGWSEVPTISSSTNQATAGYYQLNWGSTATNSAFLVQESTNEAFSNVRTIYRGNETASVVSGRKDGIYYYRVRLANDDSANAWSEPVSVEVKHHDLSKAFGFFIIGLIVFIATLVTILRGTKSHQ